MTGIEEDRKYGSGNSTSHGYMVEWRLKPESVVLATLLRHNDVGERWLQAPYEISQLGRHGDAQKVVQPRISKFDGGLFGMSENGLVSHRVAVAVCACLRTSIEERLLKHIEWRIVRIELQKSYQLERSEDDQKSEKRKKEFDDIFSEYAESR